MFLTPTLSFTIPSVHDGHKLDCRVFHPRGLSTPPPSQSAATEDAEEEHTNAPPPWARHIAIGSQPYYHDRKSVIVINGCYLGMLLTRI